MSGLIYRAESKFGLFSIDFVLEIVSWSFQDKETKGAEESFAQNKNGTIADSAISNAQAGKY